MRRIVAVVLLGVAIGGSGSARAQGAPTADLAIVSNTASVLHAKVGREVTFTIVATNYGPEVSDLFVQADQTSESLLLGPVVCDRFGVCDPVICDRAPFGGPSVDQTQCEFSEVQVGERVTATIAFEVQATGSRYASDTACVALAEFRSDPNPANDCATATLRIVGKRK